jgi:HD-GYP domain-containing protein (c-di-GMP phosphodiesterase class II)
VWKSWSDRRVKQPLIWETSLVASATTLSCLLLLVWNPALFRYLNDKAFDVLSSALPPHLPTGDIVIVDIDNATLAKVGRWPWNRNTMAQLLQNIDAFAPSVVVLDVMFPERGLAPNDALLANALRGRLSIIGYDFVFDNTHGKLPACLAPPRPLLSAGVLSARQAGAISPLATGVICDIPELSAAAAGSGFMNVIHDSDGKIRRASVITAYDDALYPSLPFAAALTREESSPPIIGRQSNRRWLSSDRRRLALTDGATFLIRYRGAGCKLRYVSAADVLAESAPPTQFAGKIVLVGSSAQAIEPSVATPTDPNFPGIEVQATVIDNLIAGDYFYRPVWASFLELVEVALVAFLSASLLFRWPAQKAIAVPFLLAACAWVLSQLLLLSANAFVAPVMPSLAALGALKLFGTRAIFLHAKADRKAQADLVMANQFITGTLSALTTLRDVETGQHVIRIQPYLRSLCQVVAARPRFAAYLKPAMIDLLVQVAPIHDIGKVGVPDHILCKPGELTADEFELMKTHVSLGKKLLEDARKHSGLRNDIFFQTATDLVYSHHERWDGTGYPLGLSGDEIPIPGRLLAVADAYDALISKRHYKTEILHAEAVARIRTSAGSHFDPEIVRCFLLVQDDWRRMADAHRDERGQVSCAYK